MRISDWSSDVCSADLRDLIVGQAQIPQPVERNQRGRRVAGTTAEAGAERDALIDEDFGAELGARRLADRACRAQHKLVVLADVGWRPPAGEFTITVRNEVPLVVTLTADRK